KAHRAGISHRGLADHVFRVHVTAGGARQLWVLGWEAGDVASSDLARRVDQAQLLTVTALLAGVERAIAVAVDVLPAEDLRAVGSLLQSPAMPGRTREQLRAQRGQTDLLAELRQALVERFPQAEVEPQQLARVSARTVISALLTAVALMIVLTSFNLSEVTEALKASRWYWALASFGFGLVGVLGAALILIAFAPVKIGLGKAWVSQLAAGYVAVSVPAGIGTAGLNLRFLAKRGVAGTLATATAALIQVSQITMTVLTLVALTLATGSNQSAGFRVSPTILIVAAVLAGIIGVLFTIPQPRAWILGKILPTLRQTWPRLVELVSNPGRLVLGLGGNLLMLLGYALAFSAALWAFGRDLPFASSSIAYLIGNSAGSAAPTPGGMGAIEAAELAALGAAGINAGVAASVVVVFRVATFWIRIPLGWLAYRWLERHNDL
ncbi:MAG: flippase-like domain-containing protein, partial [Propionibacteriaceae bacterium]|nr:flippase-like domain-containing protein [Propionibacteriaceae bacterium]